MTIWFFCSRLYDTFVFFWLTSTEQKGHSFAPSFKMQNLLTCTLSLILMVIWLCDIVSGWGKMRAIWGI